MLLASASGEDKTITVMVESNYCGLQHAQENCNTTVLFCQTLCNSQPQNTSNVIWILLMWQAPAVGVRDRLDGGEDEAKVLLFGSGVVLSLSEWEVLFPPTFISISESA